MTFIEAQYHPFLFAAMTLAGMAELGLTSFLISAGNANGTWPSPRYHALLIIFCFNATWTTLFSMAYILFYLDTKGRYVLANVASSVIWLLVTSILWGTASGIMHNTRTGGKCGNRAPISRCRQSLTVEMVGWTEFGLCLLALFGTCYWIWSERWRRRLARNQQSGSQTQLV